MSIVSDEESRKTYRRLYIRARRLDHLIELNAPPFLVDKELKMIGKSARELLLIEEIHDLEKDRQPS